MKFFRKKTGPKFKSGDVIIKKPTSSGDNIFRRISRVSDSGEHYWVGYGSGDLSHLKIDYVEKHFELCPIGNSPLAKALT